MDGYLGSSKHPPLHYYDPATNILCIPVEYEFTFEKQNQLLLNKYMAMV